MLKCVKNIKKNAFFLRKIWFFGVYGIILQMYTIFINVKRFETLWKEVFCLVFIPPSSITKKKKQQTL